MIYFPLAAQRHTRRAENQNPRVIRYYIATVKTASLGGLVSCAAARIRAGIDDFFSLFIIASESNIFYWSGLCFDFRYF